MQGHKAGNSLIETRRKNRALIKNTIFRTPDATRTGVAKELGMTLATLSTSVSEMIAEGILQETERTENSGRTGSGRKALKVVFLPAAALAVGIDLGPYETRGILMDLGGNVLRELSQPAERYSYDRMLSSVEQLIRRLVSGCTAEEEKHICGVAVGVPGVVETVSGRIRATACRSWEGHTLAGDLAERISRRGRLGIDWIINNTNLAERTEPAMVEEGEKTVLACAERLGNVRVLTSGEPEVLKACTLSTPTLEIRRHMVPEWMEEE